MHKKAINFCEEVLRNKHVEWKPMFRNNLSQPISDVDLVVTVGGDGTLLQASHVIADESIPILGVNSDPTQDQEVYSSFSWLSGRFSIIFLLIFVISWIGSRAQQRVRCFEKHGLSLFSNRQ